MGLTSVAVLHNDFCGEIEREGGAIGGRMSLAMQRWNSVTLEGHFRVGRVIARDHSSAHQVVVVHGNTGCSVRDATDVSYLALAAMADCLKRHGWSAAPPKKKRTPREGSKPKAETPLSGSVLLDESLTRRGAPR